MEYTQEKVDCAIEKAKCCFGDLAYDMLNARSQGDLPTYKCLYAKTRLVFAYIRALCGYTVVGGQLTTGEYAKWALNIIVSNVGSRIVVTLGGVPYSFFLTTNDPAFATVELLAYLNTQGFNGYITVEGYMVILAAAVGTEYNGDAVTVAYAFDYAIVGQTGTVTGVNSGVYEDGVNPTYQTQTTLTNVQAESILNNLSSLCKCGC